jgi:hypothetical protein
MKKKKAEEKKIDCADAVARFNDFMDNYLRGKAKQELMYHIAECRQCLERFEFEQLLKSRVRALSKFSKNYHTLHYIEKLIAKI